MPEQRIRRPGQRLEATQQMLDAEAGQLHHELAEYREMSLADLSSECDWLKRAGQRAAQSLLLELDGLAERDRLAMMMAIFRDFHYLMELYRTSLGLTAVPLEATLRPVASFGSTRLPANLSLPFSEWLFDEEDG